MVMKGTIDTTDAPSACMDLCFQMSINVHGKKQTQRHVKRIALTDHVQI